MDELRAELKKLIIDELALTELNAHDIDDDAPIFGEILGLDSLDALQLAVAIEERFGVRIDGEEEGEQAFASVASLAAFITERRARTTP